MMNMSLLSHLSQETETGNSLWAVLTANEYLTAKDPLRSALSTKCRLRLSGARLTDEEQAVATAILDGHLLNTLPQQSTEMVRALDRKLANHEDRHLALGRQSRRVPRPHSRRTSAQRTRLSRFSLHPQVKQHKFLAWKP